LPVTARTWRPCPSRITFASGHGEAVARTSPSPSPSSTRVIFSVFEEIRECLTTLIDEDCERARAPLNAVLAGEKTQGTIEAEPMEVAKFMKTVPGLSILALAIFYLAGPLLIVRELFKPELSVPILLACTMWAFALARSAIALDKGRTINSSVLFNLLLLTLCVVWIYFSGIGSYAICRWDYVKHNIMFSYLLDHRLPIETDLEGRRFILHYSLAYYITPVRLKEAFELLLPHASLTSSPETYSGTIGEKLQPATEAENDRPPGPTPS
jgi:hypothetical protein